MAGISSTNAGESPATDKEQRKRKRTAALTPADFRRLREASGQTLASWAALLDCGEQSVRNIESGDAGIGRQMGKLAKLLAYPAIRALLPEIERYTEELLKNSSDTH